jgi:hypothetical protein
MFKNLISLTMKSNSWKISQISIILNESLLGFLTAFLIIYGVSEQNILLILTGIYFTVANIFNFGKKIISNRQKLIFNIGFFIVLLMLLSSYFMGDSLKIISLIVSAFLILLFKDLFGVNSFSEINKIADINNINSVQLLSFSVIMSMFFTAIMLPILGFTFDYNSDYVFFISAIIISLILYLINFKLKDTKKDQINKIENFKIPKEIFLQCLLSTMYNAVSFLTMRFIVPIFIIEIGIKYGLNENMFKYIGSFLGVLALLNLVSKFTNPDIKINSNSLMFVNYFIGMICFMGIGLIYFFINNVENINNLHWYFAFIALLLFIYNFTTKFWSIGFIDSLKNESEKHKNPETAYKQYLNIFMAFKSYGAFLGFAISFIFYSFLNIETILILISFLSLIYGLYAKIKLN